MTENEKKEIMNLADMIKGEINRMCITKDLSEFDSMCLYAKRNIEKLEVLIYHAKFKERGEET